MFLAVYIISLQVDIFVVQNEDVIRSNYVVEAFQSWRMNIMSLRASWI